MVRLLYITGVVLCAVLIGYSANRLKQQYQDGTLFDEYNSQRRASIALLVASSLGLAAACVVEVVRIRRRFARSGGFGAMYGEKEPAAAERKSTSIYSAPVTVDAWESPPQRITGRKSSRRSKSLPVLLSKDRTGLWMSLLRIYCGVLPVVYSYTLFNYLFFWLPDGAGTWWLSILFPLLLLGAVLTSVGILRRRTWGRKIGFAMAMFHLLMFPIGTLGGFIMLIALIGATSEFDVISRRRLRSRRAKRKKAKAAVV